MPHRNRHANTARSRSTAKPAPPVEQARRRKASGRKLRRALWRRHQKPRTGDVLGDLIGIPGDLIFIVATTLAAFLLLGYHPYAEDGGIYAAAVAAKLDPALFPHDRPWVTGHTSFSLYVPAVAGLVRSLHVSLATGLPTVQLLSLGATTLAMLALGRLCFGSASVARWSALLVMVSAGLPVAGTSLYLVDPYATARSLSTPLLLFATVAGLRGRWAATTVLWLTAAACHPLMAAWSALPLLLLRLPLDPAPLGPHAARYIREEPAPPPTATSRLAAAIPARAVGLCTLLIVMGVLLCIFAPPADALTLELARTRGYWFLSQWHWYELAGALLPPILLCMSRQSARWTRGWTASAFRLSRSVVFSTFTGLVLACLCARTASRTVAIARLQPMRTLHLCYAVFLLLFAGTVVRWLLQAYRGRLCLVLGFATAASLVCMQHSLYPSSGWMELPRAGTPNAWEQAFLWARDNTPIDALFALDSSYTTASGEDAQGFRAVALRSVLPDGAKDAGIASVIPSLAPAWQVGNRVSTGLDSATDDQRRSRLLPLGVRWVILPNAASTALGCPYRNRLVKVCRLR